MSACYFLWRLPDARVRVHRHLRPRPDRERRADPSRLEATFDANVARIDASRVIKIVDDSRRALLVLQEEGASFDVIYVDGSHLGLDVLVDAALGWRLLARGGAMIFDDHRWNDNGDDALLRPGPAIDAFLGIVSGKYDLLQDGAQLAIRKTSPS